jgi:hypothetical protein
MIENIDNNHLAWFAFLKDLGLLGGLLMIISNEKNIKKEKNQIE